MPDRADNSKCLVIGASGLVGRVVGSLLTGARREWVGTYNRRPEKGLVKLDITSETELDGMFGEIAPGLVFHCANLAGGVDFCESHPREAGAFHLDATVKVGRRCGSSNAMLVFISTDYIFDGAKRSYKEEDMPHPLNVYGRLKLEAEEWIRTYLRRYLIIRTTNVYGWDPMTATPNYMMGLCRTLWEKRFFNAPSYLWGTPTYAQDLARAMIELCSKNASGVFHVVGKSFVNRLDWANAICRALELDRSLVKEVSSPPDGMIPRPLKSRLETEKFTKRYDAVLHDLPDGLELVKKDMEECRIRYSAS